MKKHILLGAALLSLFAASCSNDDIINNDNEVVNGKTITLNASINNGADTRLAYTDNGSSMQVAWSDSESFTMYKGAITEGSTFTKTAESGSKFKGTDIEGDGKYYAVYGEDITNSEGTLTIDLSGDQVGTRAENGIKEFMLASADALNSSTTLTFNHKLTVLKMTLTLPEDVTGTVSMVTVSGLHNKASYSLNENTYSYADEYYCAITATNGGEGFTIGSDHTITAYVAVFPEAVTANQVKLIANVGLNDYAYTITNERTLTAGKVVPVSASLALVEKNFKSNSNYKSANYYAWDAYSYVTNGDKETFSENNGGYHKGTSVTAEHSCASCPTAEEMKMYLGAGVYLDDGSTSGNGYYDGNKQTYKIDYNTYNAGLWVMKKAYISGFSAGSAKAVDKVSSDENSDCWHIGRPAASEIGKYFFLPATGYYNSGFHLKGTGGCYWSSSPDDYYEDKAYRLYFVKSYASVDLGYRDLGDQPMVSE